MGLFRKIDRLTGNEVSLSELPTFALVGLDKGEGGGVGGDQGMESEQEDAHMGQRETHGDIYSVAVEQLAAASAAAKYRLSVEAPAGKRVYIRRVSIASLTSSGSQVVDVVRATARTGGGTGDATQINLNGKAAKTSGCTAKYTTTTDDLTLTAPIVVLTMELSGTVTEPKAGNLQLDFLPGELVLEDGQVLAIRQGACVTAGAISAVIWFQLQPGG